MPNTHTSILASIQAASNELAITIAETTTLQATSEKLAITIPKTPPAEDYTNDIQDYLEQRERLNREYPSHDYDYSLHSPLLSSSTRNGYGSSGR